MSVRLENITDIEQGAIDNYGNQSSSNRVRSAGRYLINFGQRIKISVQSNSNIRTNIMLYVDSTTNRALWDSGWFGNNEDIDISDYPTAKYFRVVLSKSDGTNITPSDIISCNAEIYETDCIWHIKDNELTCDNFYTTANSEMTKPYPKSYFRVGYDGNITSELIPELQHKEGRPLAQWYISEHKGLTNNFMPEKVLAGAFANAINLSEVVIPRSCKKIGRYAFSKTKLKLVVIASDCEYYPTSFPDGCVVSFYPD